MTSRVRILTVSLALVFLAIHLRYLPHSPEDIDSINFALGVELFDVARHQPHPPGYPVFIAMGKVSTHLVGLAHPEWDRDRRAAAGLAIWGVIFGTAGAFVLVAFWQALGSSPLLSFVAAFMTMSAPLYWITSERPLTDIPGLVGAMAVQTGLLWGFRTRRDRDGALPMPWIVAAFFAGLLIGLRTQTMWLTGPMLCWAVASLVKRREFRSAALLLALAALGALSWAIPLVWSTGGLREYLAATGAQGAEDFTGVEMLATHPTVGLLRLVLERTFLHSWMVPALGLVVAALAALGAARLLLRERAVFGYLALAFGPYFVFHALFHEAATTRYALPMIVPMVGLALAGLQFAGRHAATAGGAAIAVAALVLVQPMLQAYSADRGPTFRALSSVRDEAEISVVPHALVTHGGLRRTVDWYRPVWDAGAQPGAREREWLRLVEHWRDGEAAPAWLLADRLRSDVSLFDWRNRRLVRQFLRPPNLLKLVGGNRTEEVAWWEITRPGWMLGQGWALTPEIAGVTFSDRRGPELTPADGYLLRSTVASTLMIGGRYLSGEGPAVAVVRIDGREVARLTIRPTPNWFLEWIDLPAGALEGEGPYAALTVAVEPERAGQPSPRVGLEQFDFAAAGQFMYGLGQGWLEAEENRVIGRSWRWSTEKSEIIVRGATRELSLVLRGESPLRYFDDAPEVVVSTGAREVGRFEPASDFDELIAVPLDALPDGRGVLTIASDHFFVPAETGRSEDRRHLSLRLYAVELRDR